MIKGPCLSGRLVKTADLRTMLNPTETLLVGGDTAPAPSLSREACPGVPKGEAGASEHPRSVPLITLRASLQWSSPACWLLCNPYADTLQGTVKDLNLGLHPQKIEHQKTAYGIGCSMLIKLVLF